MTTTQFKIAGIQDEINSYNHLKNLLLIDEKEFKAAIKKMKRQITILKLQAN